MSFTWHFCPSDLFLVATQIYSTSDYLFLGLQLIQQDERVSMGTDGNLYFSHALQNDSRQDYCCNAAFPKLRTIVQKIPMAVTVRSCRFTKHQAVLPKIWPNVTLWHHVYC